MGNQELNARDIDLARLERDVQRLKRLILDLAEEFRAEQEEEEETEEEEEEPELGRMAQAVPKG